MKNKFTKRWLLKAIIAMLVIFNFSICFDVYEVQASNSDNIYNGVDYSAVYNKDYYYNHNPDVKKAFGYNSKLLLQHFVQAGMREGRQAKETFDVRYYRDKYPDLKNAYGNDYTKYFYHFMANGAKERRIGYSYTKYEGIDYSLVYNKDYYLNKYPDIKRAYGDNPIELLKHFIRSGMNEGRQGIANFSMQYYRDKYIDLKRAFGNNNKAYYMHFINAGKREGRRGCSENSYNGVDYSLVYDMNYYYNNNPDVRKAFGKDADKLIQHFVQAGMNEGRRAKDTFDVKYYKSAYIDLRRAYGNKTKEYYLHYMRSGHKEGRQTISDSYYNGIDYSLVYDKEYYLNKYPDLQKAIGNNSQELIKHFVRTGMSEGRQASINFDVNFYKEMYSELKNYCGTDNKNYYVHYMNIGYKQGYKGTSELILNGWYEENGKKYYYVNDKAYTGWNMIAGRKYYFDKTGALKSKIGIDVSKYQGKIDWQKVKNDGIEYAIIRVGYGDDLKEQDDPTAVYNMQECERLGIPYGVYIYSYALTESQIDSEVSHVMRMIKGFNPKLGIFFDMEDKSLINNLTKDELNAFAYRFLNQIKNKGYIPWLYSNKYWLTTYLTSTKLQEFPLWIANYDLDDKDSPDYDKPYKMWQYTSKGSVNGITGNVDMNVLLIE